MVLRNYCTLIIAALLLMLSGCYHLRVEAEPIAPRIVTIAATSPIVMGKILKLVEDEWHRRILDTENSMTLITVPYHFATDTGLGQPAGGRKYYMQLKIEIRPQAGQTVVTVSPYNYELRTTYAYNLDAQVRTLYKHYPYEQYPGMFDLAPLNQELDSVSAAIKNLFRE